MKSILKTIDLLDEAGQYRWADILSTHLVKTAAFPYNLSALDELPLDARYTTWRENENDYEEYDDKFWKELKIRIPDYRTPNTDSDEQLNMEGEMHGPDPVPGPAYVDPTNLATSPSMNGDLDYFTWEEAREVNHGTDYWKNLLPRH